MKKFLKGFDYAFKGLKYAFHTQINFKFQILAAAIIINLGYYVGLGRGEWLWIITAITMVLVLELLNTTIEVFVDMVSPDHHPKAGIIKDVSAGAVLLASAFALAVGLFIFLPKFF